MFEGCKLDPVADEWAVRPSLPVDANSLYLNREPKCRTGFRVPGDFCLRSESMSTILLIVLVLLVLGALPTWPYSTGWGYYPSGGLGLVVVIVLILVLMGRI